MTPRRMGWVLAATLLGAVCFARGQSTPNPNAPGPLPSLPPEPAAASPVLPKTGGPITLYSSRPQDVPPPAPPLEGEDAFCTSPNDDGIKAAEPKTAEQKKAWNLYTRDIEPHVWKYWKPEKVPHGAWSKGTQLRIRFEILQDGKINDPVIMMTSGRESYDRNAMDAIKNAVPFAPPPPGLAPVKVCFRFLYNMEPKPRDPLPPDFFSPKTAKQ